MPSLPAALIGFVLLFGGIFLFLLAFGDLADQRLLQNTALSKCRSVALGPVALAGKASGEGAIESFIAHSPSFISRVVVEALVQSGRSSQWKTVHRREFRIPFYIEDTTGKVLVDPERCTLFLREDVRYSTETDESVWAPAAIDRSYAEDKTGFLGTYLDEYCLTRGISTRNSLRFKEWNLCPGDPVYVFGIACSGKDQGGNDFPVVRKTFWRTPYILEGNKAEMIAKLGLRKFFRMLVGVLLAVASAATISAAAAAGDSGSAIRLNTPEVYFASFWTLLGMAGLGIVLYGSVIYNGLVSLRNEVDRSFSNVDVLLKQRFDLVPNLVSVCRGYMEHEASIMQAVSETRGQWSSGGNRAIKLQAASSSANQLRELFARAESYPQLRANENFIELQKTLSDIEEQIADRRELYNSAVSQFNSRCQTMPDSWLAGGFGFRPQPFFRADDKARTVPAI